MFKPKKIETTDEIIGWKTELVYDSGPGYVDTTGHEEKKPIYKTIPIGEDSWRDDFLVPMHNHFKNNFFLEVQAHPQDIQKEYNRKIMEVHREYNIPIIHANDSHYIYPEQSKYRNLFLKAKDIIYEDEDEFILDYPDSDEIYRRYELQGILTPEEVTEALENTLIFDRAEAVFTDKEFKIPNVPDKFIQEELGPNFNNKDNDKVLREIIGREFQKRKRAGKIKDSLTQTYIKEITDEVETVRQCGMAGYFVLDHVAVKRAIDKYGAVITRSGRGSAVSFIINNFLGLTEVDRIKAPTRLYPSRFMSAERILSSRSLPDIDLNFSDVTPVIKATKDILGEDGVYYMVAYKPLQRSSAFRLWCKAIGKELSEYDEVAKLLSDKSYTDEMFVEQNPEFAQVLEDSKVFRGVIESIAPSPCSFLLSNDPISEKVGLIKVGDEICCCLDGYNCDVYKFLKND
jgi:DNA polymerase III alpha subunit